MAPRAGQVAEIMLRDADHSLADQPIVRVGSLRGQRMEPLRQFESNAMPTAGGVISPQAPQRPQPVLGIVKALRNLEGPCVGHADLGAGRTPTMNQRCAHRGVELHLVARIPARSGPESGERPLGAAAALLQQRQAHPEGDRGGGQRHPDRSIAAWRKGPVERRAQIVDFPSVIGQPFVRRPRRRFTLSALEKIAVVLGVAARDPFALAALVKLLDRVGAGGVEQPEPRSGAADIGDDQRFRHQIGQPVYRIDARRLLHPSPRLRQPRP